MRQAIPGSSSSGRKSLLELVGETVREIGILVVVFGPLDGLFREKAVAIEAVATLALAGLILISVGLWLESEKK